MLERAFVPGPWCGGIAMKNLKILVTLLTGVTLAGPAGAACDPDRNSIPSSRYEMNGGEVLDKETGLTWRRCSVGQSWKDGEGCVGQVRAMSWAEARKEARQGWRLPTRDELSGLISMACSPSINPDAFPHLDPLHLWYWSATQTDRDLAWLVQFGGGAVFNGYQTSANAVRLVRDGK